MKSLKTQILAFILIFCLATYGFAQEHPNFTFKPERPTNGKPIELSYSSKGTPLEGKDKVTSVVYQYRNYKWVATDLPFTGGNDTWKATFNVPADCGFLAFKFKADTLIDNNHDMGYWAMMQDKDRQGRLAPGSYLGWGVARSPKTKMDIPGYINFKGISDTATYMWFNQEITFNQEAKSKLALPYAYAVKNYLKEEGDAKLRKAIAFLSRADAAEAELLDARTISGDLLGDKKLKDSIEQVLTQKFPKGSLARLAAYKQISSNKDMAVVLKASEQFLADYPIEKTNAAFDQANYLNYGSVYQNIIVLGGFISKNDDYLKKYVDLLPYSVLSTIYYKVVDIPWHRKDEPENRLLAKADLLMARYKFFLKNQPSDLLHLSPLEWKATWDKERANFEYLSYIGLLMAGGRNDEALQLTELTEQYLDYKNASVNNYYATLLQKKNETEKLNMVLKMSFFNNQATTEMLAMLKEAYVKQKGSEVGFEAYADQMKNPADKARFEKDVAAGMIGKQMPEWSMKDLNGKTVSSKALRGKTVVLDFWATWCVPCKASFPGMKLAVEKYKNDKDVVFYFVDTEERSETYKAEVAKYIKDNNYPFNILFDNKLPGAKINSEVYDKICKAFTISGIPQKLFVDKTGMLQFISVGYNGSASALADDISTLVEMTKKG